MYFTATGLFEYFSKRMREEDTEDYIEEVDVILIDDLGTEFSNSPLFRPTQPTDIRPKNHADLYKFEF